MLSCLQLKVSYTLKNSTEIDTELISDRFNCLELTVYLDLQAWITQSAQYCDKTLVEMRWRLNQLSIQ